MGRRVDPETAVIHVDGCASCSTRSSTYLALNKPRGMLSTMSDDQGRTWVGDLLVERGVMDEHFEGGARARLFHVGRLDADTEGLLLLMNDGELGHRLMHPSYEVREDLHRRGARLDPPRPGQAAARRRRAGRRHGDGRLVQARRCARGKSMVELVIHEGRKHVVRRLLEEVGYPVLRLVRTAVGDVQLGNQRPGRFRGSTHAEIGSLYRSVGL